MVPEGQDPLHAALLVATLSRLMLRVAKELFPQRTYFDLTSSENRLWPIMFGGYSMRPVPPFRDQNCFPRAAGPPFLPSTMMSICSPLRPEISSPQAGVLLHFWPIPGGVRESTAPPGAEVSGEAVKITRDREGNQKEMTGDRDQATRHH